MKKWLLILVLIGFFCSCVIGKISITSSYNSVIIDTLLQDKISIRALVLDKEKIWYAADKSRFGCIDLNSNQKKEIQIPTEKNSEFRSIAQTNK